MPEAFDPYYQWLGIPPDDQPPNHYRLLGLPIGESDPSLIAAASDQRAAVVEAQRGGPHEDHCDRLLAEVRRARDTLLDQQTRAAYDRAIHSAPPPPIAAPPIANPPITNPPIGGAPIASALIASPAPTALPESQSEPESNPPKHHDPGENVATGRQLPASLGWVVSVVSLAVIMVASWLITSHLMSDGDDIANSNTPGRSDKPPEKIEPPPDIDPNADDLVVVMQEGDGSVLLKPIFSRLSGEVQIVEEVGADVLESWSVGDEACWKFRLTKPGALKVLIEYAADDAWADAEYEISIDGASSKSCAVRKSGGSRLFHEDEYFLAAKQNGEHTFTLKALGLANEGLMVLKSIRLVAP